MHALVPRLLLVGILATASLAQAQWSSVPSSPNTPVVLPQGASAMTSPRLILRDGAGGSFLVWADNRTAPSDINIFAQHVSAAGEARWGTAGVPVIIAPGHQYDFNAIADGVGGLYVAWDDQRAGQAAAQLRVQRLGPDGQPMWAADGVAVPHPGQTLSSLGAAPGLVVAPDGGLYVLYSLGTVARVQRLTPTGTIAAGWPAAGVEVVTFSYPVRSRALVVSQADGEAEPGVLAFVTGGSGAWAVKVTAEGTIGFSKNHTSTTLSALGTIQEDVGSDGIGGLLGAARANQYIWVYRVTKTGDLAWSNAASLVSSLGGNGYSINVVPTGDGGGIVTWHRITVSGTSQAEIRAQRLSPTGEPLWAAGGLVVYTGQANPQDTINGKLAVSDGAGGVVVAWRSPSPARLTAQRLDPAGNRLWGEGLLVSSGSGTLASLATDDASGAIYLHTSEGRTFQAMRTTLTGTLGSNSPLARLANISARASVGSGNAVLIPGFVVSGGSVRLLVRGVGPTLLNFDVQGLIVDPQLSLVSGAGVTVASNNDWGAAANLAELTTVSAQVGAFALEPGSKDAAMLVTLPPGLYTAVMSSALSGQTGVGLVEIYEVDGAASAGRLVNMSVCALVGGTGARTLLVRAVGPTLSGFGVSGALANPTMTLFSGPTALGTNDNWSSNATTGPQIAAAAAQVGAFSLPSGSQDAALLLTLAPGPYTIQVSGVGGTGGICLVEVYEVP
jgi:hypothetical protein